MKMFVRLVVLACGLAATTASAALTAGLEAAYLTDSQEAYWAGRVGWEFKATPTLSHQVELELGHAEQTERIMGITGTMKVTPITINYRAETTAANKLGFYGGIGVGRSKVNLSISGTVPSFSFDDDALVYQAFAGLRYQATPAASLQVGVKYLVIENIKLFNQDFEVGSELALTAGVSIRF